MFLTLQPRPATLFAALLLIASRKSAQDNRALLTEELTCFVWASAQKQPDCYTELPVHADIDCSRFLPACFQYNSLDMRRNGR
jgi:hypothetical protein